MTNRTLNISGNSDNLLSSLHFLGNQAEELIPFVSPVSVQPTPIQLQLPRAYAALYEAWLHLAFAEMGKDCGSRRLSDQPPPIGLILRYQDIGDEDISQEYDITLHAVAFMPQGPDSGESHYCMMGYAEPRRLK